MTCEGELELTTSQLPYLGGEERGGEGRRGEGRGGEGRRRELKDGKEKRCDTLLSLVSHALHWSKVVTAVAMNAVRSYLNDSVIGACGKPLVAWVHCNASHPPKMAADNLRGTYGCDFGKQQKTPASLQSNYLQVSKYHMTIQSHMTINRCHMHVT